MLRPVLVALIGAATAACSAGAPATTTPETTTPETTPPPITSAPATPTGLAITTSPVAVVTPSPASAEPTVAPQTSDPYYNPDDRYTPRPTPASTPDPITEQVLVSVSSAGNYLVGPDGMTLYVFDEDEPDESNCNGGCLAAWPALSVDHDQELVGGDGVDGELAVFHRPDDSHQASYNGQPLYYYTGDQAPGDTTGDGVNGTWHLAVP